MPAGHYTKTHHCPGMKKMQGNYRMEGKLPNSEIKYCPSCGASPLKKYYVMVRTTDFCPNICEYKHPEYKENVKARENSKKKEKEAAAKANIEECKAKVAAQKATAAARKNGG